jgi:hypothetical protein
LIQMKLAVISRAVKDLDAEKEGDKTSAISYLFGQDFLSDCKKFAIDPDFIQRDVKDICSQEGVRRKHLMKKLLYKLKAYT